MQKKILTQEDFDNNPELAEQGLKVGDEIEIPDEETTTDGESTGDNLSADEDTGGSNPPPNKGRG